MKTNKNPKRPPGINRQCYAMALGDDAEITMYGEIVIKRPTDWWGDPVDGDFIIASEFLADFERAAGARSITLRMNSVGGSLYAALPIYNRISDIRDKVTCIVDGVAMSAASLIMCACGTVKVRPACLVMLHKCWLLMFGGYNADELRAEADGCDAWDKAAIAGYKRKCGLPDEDILRMMSLTTYLTGQEAIDKGFADELLDGEPAQIAASADGKMLFVNGRTFTMPAGLQAPDIIPTITSPAAEAEEVLDIASSQTDSKKGGSIMAKTLEELRTENPELAAQVESEVRAAAAQDTSALDEARAAERKRLADIDAIACLYDDETVKSAKYGENTCTAQEMAFRAAQKAAQQGTAFMAAASADYQASGAAGVGAAPQSEEASGSKTNGQRKAEAKSAVKALLSKKEGK